MGYREMIKQQVKKAFKTIGNLAIDVTLTQSDKSGFNFATNEPTALGATISSKVKCIDLRQKNTKSKEAAATVVKTLLFDAESLSNPDVYDSVTMPDGLVWNIVPPYENNGYTIKIDVSREL